MIRLPPAHHAADYRAYATKNSDRDDSQEYQRQHSADPPLAPRLLLPFQLWRDIGVLLHGLEGGVLKV